MSSEFEEICNKFQEFIGWPWQYYILDEQGQPVPTNDLYAIGRLLGNIKARKVAETHFVFRGLPVGISTRNTVLNHAHGPCAEPVLWETMVFTRSPHLDGLCQRYTSKCAAIYGHNWLVAHCYRYLRTHRPISNRRALVAERRAQRGQSVARKGVAR